MVAKLNVVATEHGNASTELTFVHLRQLAAEYMLRHREEFEPFMNSADDGGDALSFEEYCEKVASPVAAMWGGQLELRALSAVLDRPIWVYDALQPTIRMGNESLLGEPIRLAFHRHFYSLGEHYNSVVKK